MSGIVGNEQTSGLGGMIALLADPAKLAATLSQYEQARAQATDAIALVGPAEDIPRLHAQALADRAEAARALEVAKREADVLRATAAREVQQIRAQAEADSAELRRQADELRAAATALQQQARDSFSAAQEEYAAAERATAAARIEGEQLAEAKAKAEAKLVDYSTKLTNLATLVQGLQNDLQRL